MKNLSYKLIKDNFNASRPDLITNFQIIRDEIIENENDIATLNISVANKPDISRGTGAPSGGSDKDLYVDDTGGSEKLYVNVNGTWKYTSLT